MRVPKLRRVGASTAGPPASVQVSFSRWACSSIVHATVMRPFGTDNAPNFVVLVHSSFIVNGKAGVRPAHLQQQIMRAPKCDKPAFDRLLPVLNAGRRPQALRRNGGHRRERILDAVVQLFEDELL